MAHEYANAYERDIQDYLDATGESAERFRNVILVLVITTVLLFSGLLKLSADKLDAQTSNSSPNMHTILWHPKK